MLSASFQKSFVGMPNEIIAQIFERLNMKDRKNLAAVNERFDGLENVAGYRKLDAIEVNCVSEFPFSSSWMD